MGNLGGKAGDLATYQRGKAGTARATYGAEYYDYAAPPWVRKAIERRLGYPDLDVASSYGMEFGRRHYTPEQDGLKQNWYKDSGEDLVWCHPPYDTDYLGEWVGRAWAMAQKGCVVACMLPTWRKYTWLDDYVYPFGEVLYPTRLVVLKGFGPMKGKQCGNTNWYNEYETVFAIFRKGQRGFCGGWL